jgi:hypothetical protein
MTDVVRPVGVLRTRVEIRTYPRDDEAFRRLVLEQLRRFDRVRHAAAIPARLEVLLQQQYPRARSRYQDPLAASAGIPLLYVFRDGGALGAVDSAETEPEGQRAVAMTGGSSTAA